MKGLFLLLGGWLLTAGAMAQPTLPTPQLWQALRQHPQADTQRVDLLNQLADYETVDGLASEVPKARRDSLAQQALALARRLRYRYGAAYAQFSLPPTRTNTKQGASQWARQVLLPLAERSGNPELLVRTLLRLGSRPGPTSLAYLQRATALARALPRSPLLLRAYSMQGAFFKFAEGDYYKALQAQSQELRAAQQAHLVGGTAYALIELGELYLDSGDYAQARTYFQQSLQTSAGSEHPSYRLFLRQGCLLDLGDCNRLSGRYPQALAAYQQALPLAERAHSRLTIEAGIADVYERQHSPRSLTYVRQVLRQVRAYAVINSAQTVALAHQLTLTLGHYYLRASPTDSAVAYGRQALALARRFGSKQMERDAVQLLGQAYAQRREYAPAYAYLRHYLGLRDTLGSEQTTRQVTAARFTQDMARQRSQIGLLTRNQQLQAAATHRQRLLLLATLVVLALLASLAAVFWRNNRQKQRANAVLERQKAEIQAQRDQTTQALAELRATQSQLIQKEKMASLGELTAGIAHEIQNPLNFVNNFSEVSAELMAELKEAQAAGDAEEVVALAEDVTQNLGKITQHGQRAASIVHGMLEHSRASTGERAPLDVNALCDEYLRLAYHGLRAKNKTFNATLKMDFAPALPLVEGVGPDLGRVLLNLFTNAFYAVQQRQQAGEAGYQPTVSVSTAFADQQVRIVVRDNGAGMTEAVRAKIFQPFFTTKPTGEGTGLGLSLAYDIVVQGHEGALTVESQAGAGSTFTLSLPAAHRVAATASGYSLLPVLSKGPGAVS